VVGELNAVVGAGSEEQLVGLRPVRIEADVIGGRHGSVGFEVTISATVDKALRKTQPVISK
jgi:hypothetical protein